MKRNKNRRMTLLCIAVITAMLFTSISVNAVERGDAVTEPFAASGSTEAKSDNDDIIIEPAEADDETEIQNVNENDSRTTEKQTSLDSAKAQARRVSNYTIKVNT